MRAPTMKAESEGNVAAGREAYFALAMEQRLWPGLRSFRGDLP
jgi:hypothetical protein